MTKEEPDGQTADGSASQDQRPRELVADRRRDLACLIGELLAARWLRLRRAPSGESEGDS